MGMKGFDGKYLKNLRAEPESRSILEKTSKTKTANEKVAAPAFAFA